MKVTRFAQSHTKYKDHYPIKGQVYQYWYEDENGDRHQCNDSMIENLWNVWVMSVLGSSKEKTEDWVIFSFDEIYDPTSTIVKETHKRWEEAEERNK